MTPARGLALTAVAAVVVVLAVVLLGSGSRHEYTLIFQNAGQLVKDNDVQVGGHRIGRVASIKLTSDNLAEIKIQVDQPYAPLHEGTTATIRATSLSGQANKYVALTPGPNSAPKIPDGDTLSVDTTTTPVDLDQLFDTFDPKTRKALQDVLQGSSTQYGKDGAAANAALKYFNPALSTTSKVVSEINRDQQALEDVVVSTARASTAIAARKDDLSGLVAHSNTSLAAVASESASLDEALAQLPGTLKTANSTFVDVRSALTDLDALVSASKPVAPKLAPFFAKLRPLVQDAQPTLADLRTLISRPGAGNDLIDLLNQQPRLQQIADPAFTHTIKGLEQGTPVLTFIRPYIPDLVGWFRDFGQTTANYDANGHYARVSAVVDAFKFTQDSATTGTLTALPSAQRQVGLQKGQVKRCPGAAAAVAADGSNPYAPAGSDCDKSIVVPGP